MEPIPLIPKPEDTGNHDVSSILREAFQDILGEEILATNVTNNIQKYHTEDLYVKNIANNAHVAFTKKEGRTLNYDNVEEKLMYNKSHYLICENFVNDDPMLKERVKLNSVRLLPNVDARDNYYYGLISTNDIQFPQSEIAIDSRLQIINRNQYPCEEKISEEHKQINETIHCKVDIKKENIRKPIPEVVKTSNLSRPGFKSLNYFKVIPDQVVFFDYKLEKTYKKKLIIQNITPTTQLFEISKQPASKYFKIENYVNLYKVPAGMSVQLIIEFRTNTYLDVIDLVEFKSINGEYFEGKLIAYRNAPNLRVYIFRHGQNKDCNVEGTSKEYDISRTIALNNTIDCGFCFLGSSLNISLVIHNEGGVGEFFIMTEDEWYRKNITNIDENMMLTSGSFSLFPCHFEINEDECIKITIEFIPTNYGLHLDTFYILCNNDSLEKIEIIGDGVIFEKKFVKVQLPLVSEKICCSKNEITHYFDCGTFLPRHKQIRKFKINNDSSIDLKYNMKFRIGKNNSSKFTSECKLKEDWFNMVKRGCFSCYTENDFNLEICCNTNTPGLYSGVLELIIENVPETSLETGKCFNTTPTLAENSSQSENFVNIIVASIHIVCAILPYKIEIIPDSYQYMYLKYNETKTDIIIIKSSNSIPFHCKWILDDETSIRINPTSFDLIPEVVVECQINIQHCEYEDVIEDITLSIEDGLHEEILSIMAYSEKPECGLSEFMIQLGNISKNAEVHLRELYVENLSHATINWLIIEIGFDSENKRFKEIKNRIKPFSGTLDEFGDKTYLSYNVVTNEPVVWCSFLMLITQYKLNVTINDLCFINYKVHKPKIKITSNFSDFPILFCDQVLHKHNSTIYKVYVKNVGSIKAKFSWGDPIGSQKDSAIVKFSTKSASIEPGNLICIDVEITPLELGVIENYYIPCFIESLEEPIMLKLLCIIEDIYFYIHLPNENDVYYEVLWPPAMINDNKQNTYYYDDYVSEGDTLQDPSAYPIYLTQSLIDVRQGSKSIYSSIHSGLNNNCDLCCCNADGDTESSRSNFKGTYLSEYIDPNVILQENIIEFKQVALRKPVKKTIFVENLTPLKGVVNLQVTNFYAKNVPEEKEILTNVFYNANQKQTSKFEKYMNDYGFIIMPKPDRLIIHPHEKIKIDIYVFANTWGVYCDEILLEINDCFPFTFTVIAEIVGMPIEFPFALNTINAEPTCRFDTVSYNSSKTYRKVKVKNISAIPLTVMWHVYIKEEDSTEFPTHDYFNVIFDMYDPHKYCETTFEVIDGQLLLTNDFYGWTNFKIFKIEPAEMSLEPYGTNIMNIEFNPKEIDYETTSTVVAYVIGTIFISSCYMYNAYIYRRCYGEDLELSKLKLTAKLEIPILKFISGERSIVAYACDYSEYKPLAMKTHFIFKNVNNCPTNVTAFIKYPFGIKKMRTSRGEYNENAVVYSGDVLEIIIYLKISFDEIIDMSEMFSNNPCEEVHYGIKDEFNSSLTIKKDLIIRQNNITEQRIPLTLAIYFPKFEVDVNLIHFDVVFVGTVVKTNIIIKNKSAQDIPFKITSTTNEIIARPDCGILEKFTGFGVQYKMIVINFVPIEARAYHENLKIITNLPGIYHDIVVTGSGSINENYYERKC